MKKDEDLIDFKHASQQREIHKYMKKDEDIYMEVVESARLIALMHLLYFDEIQAFNTRMNDAIMIIIM